MKATTRRIPPPKTEDNIEITVDVRTAKAIKVLTGLGTVHFSSHANSVARSYGFDSIGEAMDAVNSAKVYHSLDDII